jgi:predicted lipoprotein with Yx(FWY)xxD motif
MTMHGRTKPTTRPVTLPHTVAHTVGRGLTASMMVGTFMLAAACGSSSPSATATATTTPSLAPATGIPATGSPATVSPATASPSTTASAPATLSAANNAKIGQQIVVDGSGKTVYMYLPDGSATASTVSAALKAKWPPVTVSGTPKAGTGVDSAKVVAQPQSDGTQQVSYAGHLLYTFTGDAAAGDANGQGLGSIWYAVTPAGSQAG